MRIPYEAMTLIAVAPSEPIAPPGHVIAVGRDHLGASRIFLFEGSLPSSDGFRGSILQHAAGAIAYGRHGVYVSSGQNYRWMLEQIASQTQRTNLHSRKDAA